MNVAHFLLLRGADTSLRNKGGFTPLDASAFGGCAKCLRMLLAHPGADPTAVGPDGYNALHRAIWGDDEGHTEAVELLLEAGLSPTKPADVPGMGLIPPISARAPMRHAPTQHIRHACSPLAQPA
jgi:ankyrin repeat protein